MVVAFDFAVGLGMVLASAVMDDGRAEGLFEVVGTITGPVVGQHKLHGYPARDKERVCVSRTLQRFPSSHH